MLHGVPIALPRRTRVLAALAKLKVIVGSARREDHRRIDNRQQAAIVWRGSDGWVVSASGGLPIGSGRDNAGNKC